MGYLKFSSKAGDFMQDCGICSASALELPQSCIKPLKCEWFILKSYLMLDWKGSNSMINKTRTTRMPAFKEYPLPPHEYPYYWFILDPKSKHDKVKVTNVKILSKLPILKQTLHATHLMKLLDKMCKYKMDLVSIVLDTELTRFCSQLDGWTDGQTDKVKPVYPLSTSLK